MPFTTNLRNTLWALFTALCLFIAASAVLNLRNLHRDEEMIEAYLAPTLAAQQQAERLRQTVVDLMRLRRRVGEPAALIALRRYVSRQTARPGELLELARALDVLGPTRAALDVLESA